MSILVYLSAKNNAVTDSLRVAKSLRVRSLSGRQVLRRLEPAKAATAAFLDEQVQRGRTRDQLTVAGVPQALPAAFDATLRAGITPAEMPPA